MKTFKLRKSIANALFALAAASGLVMFGIENGISRQVRIKRQTAKGTIAPAATGGWVQRRSSGKFALKKDSYTTEAEMTASQQLLSNRHGVRLVDGSLDGILSPGTYADVISSVLRQDFAVIAPIAALSVTIAGAGPTYTVTTSTGTPFLTGGVKVGHVVRLSVGSLNAANIAKNLLVTAVTPTVLTVMPVNGVALLAEGPITGVTVTVQGKVAMVPATGHTNTYYTVEDWNPSVPYSMRNQDVKFTNVNLTLPGSGNATVSMSAQGLDQTTAATVYFVAPTAETSSNALVAASGILMINGVQQVIVTDLSVALDGKAQPADGVVGANVRPDIFRGKAMVTGSFSAYFDSSTLYDLFSSETQLSIYMVLSDGTAANAEFMAVCIPALKLNSSDSDDAETGQKRTYNFVATRNTAGGALLATPDTTISIQDSLAP